MNTKRYILASRSPRRRELLGHLVPPDEIEVLPPSSPDEASLFGLTTWSSIRECLLEIAHHKAQQVLRQLGDRIRDAIVIAADTTVVVQPGTSEPSLDQGLMCLGQPPENDEWQAVVREWFLQYFAGRTHWVATALVVAFPDRPIVSDVVTTAVGFRDDVDCWLDWYLSTGEPIGKAGGYAIQGAGSVFVTRIAGSLSNVVGLPLERLREFLVESIT